MVNDGSSKDDGDKKPKDAWLKMAKDAYDQSTGYMDNNYRKNFEDGLRMFNSRHPADSKYNSDAFKYRSKLFRPKSRAVVRKHEATAAQAFFSNPEFVTVTPTREGDESAAIGSKVMKELLQYRLSKSIPWFLISIGGLQDAMTVGLVASLNHWEYEYEEEDVEQEAMMGDAPIKFMRKEKITTVDRPVVELLPIENIRFHPGAKWYDVVNSSPYLIVQLPMYLRDILEKMDNKVWKKLTKDEILSGKVDFDSVRSAREDEKEDSRSPESKEEVNEFEMICVHLNFMKYKGKVYTYYTIKDEHMLTEAKPLKEVFLHGIIPVTIGFTVVETHKTIPNSNLMLGKDLQTEANDLANSRIDNVRFVLNKRWIVRRNANIDLPSLMRNVAGGATLAGDVEKDIREINWPDVTSSAYAEQDRINVDYDELLGNFAQSSVMTNRKMNETVGGMKIMAQGANALTEYTLLVFVMTWLEPTLRQLVKLEQAYETDETVMLIVGEKAQAFQKFGMDEVMDSALDNDMTLTVNMGMGATDPDTRFQRFMQASQGYAQLALEGPKDLNLPEIRKELFSLAGWRDAARFFSPEVDPRIVQLEQQVQEAEAKAHQWVEGQRHQLDNKESQLNQRENKLEIRELKDEVKASGKEVDQALVEIRHDAEVALDDMAADVREHKARTLRKAA